MNGLTREDLWHTCCILRSHNVAKLAGGVSALTAEIVKHFLPLAQGLLLHDGTWLFAKLHCLIGDEAALKSMWNIKGAAGTVPCLFCWNVVQRRSELHLHDRSSNLVPHTCFDTARLKLRSDRDFRDAISLLSAEQATRSKAEFAKLEQSLGINYHPLGMLSFRECPLQPVSSTMFDWLHIYLVNGIFQAETNLLLPLLKQKCGLSHDAICGFLRSFEASKSQKSNYKAAILTFEKSKSKEGWKPSASECLSVYSVLRMLVLEHQVRDPVMRKASQSFLHLCSILDKLCLINKDGTVQSLELAGLVRKHLVAFSEVYAEEHLVPKFHYSLHLAPLLQRHSMLISCFTHERKHKELKRWSNQLANAGSWFEASVLKEVTHSAINTLMTFEPRQIIVRAAKPASGFRELPLELQWLQKCDAKVSKAIAIYGMTVTSGDIVAFMLNGALTIGKVMLHIQCHQAPPFTMVQVGHGGKNKFTFSTLAQIVESE